MGTATSAPATNAWIARQLEAVATLLEEQGANQYRVQAWRNGASTLRRLPESAAEVLRREGLDGLDRLPGIGPALARAVREIAETGRLAMLERLRGRREPISVLATLPSVGKGLAERLHDTLGTSTLEELEAAVHDGRLASVPGFGPKRVAGISEALAMRLQARRRSPDAVMDRPSVAELLDVDRAYRVAVAGRRLPMIAPRRFNPERKPWLPVLHTRRGARHYTALFSNSALAHRMGRTHDWVVLYFDGQDGEHQATVVTSHEGQLAGHRVVRGRESECFAHYRLSREDGTVD